MNMLLRLLLMMVMCSGCVAPLYHGPDSYETAAYRAEAQHQEVIERDVLLKEFEGLDKMAVLNRCGQPKTKTDKPRYKDASYDESWEFENACRLFWQFDARYRTLTLYFINDHVAEADVFIR